MASLWESMKKLAVEVKDATVQAVNNATDFPTTMHCSNMKCEVVLAIPENAFDWKCPSGHINGKAAKVCADCQQAKPKNIAEPKIRCAKCETVTSVPFNNMTKDVRYAAQQAQKEYEFAKARPDQFHCSHCDAILQTPKGPWQCQTCQTTNAEEAQACNNCAQKISEQKVLCGVCNRSTKIPANNLTDKIQSTSRELSKQTQKAYFDLKGQPYVKCPTCKKPIALPKNDAGLSEGTLPGASGVGENEGEGSAVGDSSQEGEAEQAPLLADQKQERTVTCPQCSALVNFTPPQQDVPNPTGTDADAGQTLAQQGEGQSSALAPQ